MKYKDRFLSLFFPHKCTFCRKSISYKNNTFICEGCMSTLPFIKGRRCIKCNIPIHDTALDVCNNCRKFNHHFYSSFTPLIYSSAARRAILSLKFYNKESFCRSFAYLIAQNIISEGFPEFDFITYVPLSPSSFKERGYNQCELIARILSEMINVPVISALGRYDSSKKQSTLSFSERRKNARSSFYVKDVPLSGNALLIDDIYTTGSTLDYCSSLLLQKGCDRIYISAVALNIKM